MSDTLLSALKQTLKTKDVQGFLLPVNDEFQSEYPPAYTRRLEWLTGFSGSAGMAALLTDEGFEGRGKPQALFTDGRYTLQAEQEVGTTEYDHYNSGATAPEAWLAENAKPGARIGYDPWLFTSTAINRFDRAGKGKFLQFIPISPNPVDALWQNRPSAPASQLENHPQQYSGVSSVDKRKNITEQLLRRNAHGVILTAPDSINWLLNIRGADVPNTPIALCFALLEANGKVSLYLDEKRIPDVVKKELMDVTTVAPENMAQDLERMKNKTVMLDAASAPIWFRQHLEKIGAEIVDSQDPCVLPKACKNHTELSGIRQAHAWDGAAVAKLWHWLDTTVQKSNLTELEVIDRLEQFRAEHPEFRTPSFPTIAGSGPNGAIVHYRANEKSNRPLDTNSLLLLDSGGQYPGGTTDITRTLAIGTPKEEMKDRFTRVLRGHIALATAIFPPGTTGAQLDALARMPLWQIGLDYDHGTGHGVGYFLNVHEGPQRISKRGTDATLQPGMIISNEPGYYKTNEYGIRIENLVAVVEKPELKTSSGQPYLGFETITLAPIDTRLVIPTMLTDAEREWLNKYHENVCLALSPQLGKEQTAWLKERCRAI